MDSVDNLTDGVRLKEANGECGATGPTDARRDEYAMQKEMNAMKSKRTIESSPIQAKEGKWVVYFAENGKPIGVVEVYEGYTMSGWDDAANVTDEVRERCEDHAVEQYRTMMLERIGDVLSEGMSPGSCLVVIPVEKKEIV